MRKYHSQSWARSCSAPHLDSDSGRSYFESFSSFFQSSLYASILRSRSDAARVASGLLRIEDDHPDAVAPILGSSPVARDEARGLRHTGDDSVSQALPCCVEVLNRDPHDDCMHESPHR